MIVIRNRILPPKGFVAINLFGIIFVRKNANISEKTLRHEAIHSAQIKELLVIGFYALYLWFWIVNLFRHRFKNHIAYRNICFEIEAYSNADDIDYLKKRKRFAWKDYEKR